MRNNENTTGRRYDIVVWGASGFTGRLVVEYLLERYPPSASLCWAVAGRDASKIGEMLNDFGHATRPEILVADSHDAASLDRMTRDARVVISTVGPYAKFGDELVASCVRNGTDYCDLCGEVQWMRKIIDRHDDAARESGARIVMSCGFDSIPSDYAVRQLQSRALKEHGAYCKDVILLVRAMKGGASGGTFASMLNAVSEATKDPEIAKILRNPYALNPDSNVDLPKLHEQSGAQLVTTEGVWTAPFVMAAVNTRVVQRSHALENFRYGSDFRYSEAVIAGRGLGGRMKATGIALALRAFIVASAIPFLREKVLRKCLPAPGDGPDAKQRAEGFFNLLVVGTLANGESIRLRVKGDRDPGYGSTSKMLAEAAVCLAVDQLQTEGGCWTPTTALGDELLDRLQKNAGLSFEAA